MSKEIYFTATDLKRDRGWTDRLIRRFLGEPDKVEVNRRFGARVTSTLPPIRLYALARVEALEASEQFAAEYQKSQLRRNASTKAVITKIDKMVAAMEAAEITIIGGKTRDEIRDLAAATHGGNYVGDPGEFHFDDRVAVNCIRHNLTNYESLWRICNRGNTGEEAYRILRERVDELIRQTYPEYFD